MFTSLQRLSGDEEKVQKEKFEKHGKVTATGVIIVDLNDSQTMTDETAVEMESSIVVLSPLK
jgi:hypothetical protein